MILLSSCSNESQIRECIAAHDGARTNPDVIAEIKREGTTWPDKIKKYCTKLIESGKWYGAAERL